MNSQLRAYWRAACPDAEHLPALASRPTGRDRFDYRFVDIRVIHVTSKVTFRKAQNSSTSSP